MNRAFTREGFAIACILGRMEIFTPTRLIHFNTKHISLVLSSFDTIITAILPIFFGFKIQQYQNSINGTAVIIARIILKINTLKR